MTPEHESEESLPPYAFVPGGTWPHPTGSPLGHSATKPEGSVPRIAGGDWSGSHAFRRGIALFNAGYYWEAHEAWEGLWLAHGRSGAIADVVKGLIKLAAAGVKVRQGQTHGILTHARRAELLFVTARERDGRVQLGLDLDALVIIARGIADEPPRDPEPPGVAVSRVFTFRIEPRDDHAS